MIKIAMNLAVISALCSPALCAEKAADQLGGAASLSAPVTAVTAPVPAETKVALWADAAKAAYEKSQDEGGLTTFADLKELPPGARARLELELQTLPQGPGNSSEAFKMMAAGRTAFVVQSYINDDSLRVYIFNAAGVLVARGEGSADKPLVWLPI